jgi:hypothetical protein
VPGLEYLRGIEVQIRGALHDHALLWSPVPLSVGQLRARAIAAGFGHSVDLAPIEPGSKRCAYYVSKYVTKAADSRDDVPWMGDVVDRLTGEISREQVRASYRTWSSSREWGLTMAQVRAQLRLTMERLRATRVDESSDLPASTITCGGQGDALPPCPP